MARRWSVETDREVALFIARIDTALTVLWYCFLILHEAKLAAEATDLLALETVQNLGS